MALTIVTNNHSRELLTGGQLPEKVYREFFDYLGDWNDQNENLWSSRFFRYGDWWYDVNEFTVTDRDGELRKAGFDAFQSDTYFSGIAIRYGVDWSGEPDYDSVIVARIAFLDD